MSKKTFWIIFGGLAGLFVVLLIAVALTNNSGKQINNTDNAAAEQPAVTMPDDITNPGPVEDKVVTAENFPENVADLERIELLTGQAAENYIENMHQGAVKAQDSFVATYQGDGQSSAQIWVSVTASEQEAKAQLQLMHEKIGNSPAFSDHQVMPIGSILYHYVKGMGQEHFFYYRGDDVIWIAVSDHQLLPSFTGLL